VTAAVTGTAGAAGTTRPVLLFAPLRVEARALRRGLPAGAPLELVRSGAGPVRSGRSAERLAGALGGAGPSRRAVAVAGVAGALSANLAPGTVVVADQVLGADGVEVARCDSATLLAAELHRIGLPAVVGAVISVPGLVRGAEARAALARHGALAVDTETAYLLNSLDQAEGPGAPPHGAARPVAVLRVVVDTPDRELISPATLLHGAAALRRLREAAPALAAWAGALEPRRVLLAGPRSFCAGVERAIATVERALERFGAPVYVRRQIVHNRHVVQDLSRRGAVFVQELHEVPDGATVVFSAHGVAPMVRAEAAGRGLRVVDATCPLVNKVHHEVKRFSERGYRVVMIGHRGHDETEGTLGEAEGMILVEDRADVADIDVPPGERLAYITQTTLSPDDVAGVVADLTERFPGIVGPQAADICYATQNRQDAVAALARDCDLVLVVGSANSSNAARLVEVARRGGAAAELVEDERELPVGRLAGVRTLGVTAAASTPPRLVERVVAAVADLGGASVEERTTRTENVNFPLPVEVR
jgi:4-hydroxy-3-methylbut-2-enyl diphosphate reductase